MSVATDQLTEVLNECIREREALRELNAELVDTCKGLRYYLANDPCNPGGVGMCIAAAKTIAKAEALK